MHREGERGVPSRDYIDVAAGISNIKARACVYLIICQLASLKGLTFVKQRLYTSVCIEGGGAAVAL